jgi:GxxExxY protein
MPIVFPGQLRAPSQQEFAQISYKVMDVMFDIHRELGRFFGEEIYQCEAASRLAAQAEFPIIVSYADFSKTYFIDLLVDGAAPFELKAVEKLSPRHRAQLINYLFLTELPHGKLINLRTQQVKHEFVNSTTPRSDRTCFEIDLQDWVPSLDGEPDLSQWLIAAVRDWGTGLDLSLYVDAATHFFGGRERVLSRTNIAIRGRVIGSQPVRLAAPGIALKVTTLPVADCQTFELHARRFLAHSCLTAIQWINVSASLLRFKTLLKN